jgi:hypothetical protein
MKHFQKMRLYKASWRPGVSYPVQRLNFLADGLRLPAESRQMVEISKKQIASSKNPVAYESLNLKPLFYSYLI